MVHFFLNMLKQDIIKYLEDFAPPGVAWEKDNVGLQIGSAKSELTNIFLTLELDQNSLKQALKKNCNFIFTHHPLIFQPINKLNFDSDEKSKLIRELVKNDITVYSSHTNFDFTIDGVSFELAKKIGLKNLSFLENALGNQFKLVVFIPLDSVEDVSRAVFTAGGGIIGQYEQCSFRTKGTGTFKGSNTSSPAVGSKGVFAQVSEIRLEVLIDSWKLDDVIGSMIKAHPYEEPAFDIYPLKNQNKNFGFGAVGELQHGMTSEEFLSHLLKSLGLNALRYSEGTHKKIRVVAVCGGSGSDLLSAAVRKKADAFVTADIKYHAFQEAAGKILFIDAGHYETEIHSLEVIRRKLEKFLSGSNDDNKVYKYNGSTNPVKFYHNLGAK